MNEELTITDEPKKTLFTNETYELIKHAQRSIQTATEMTPAFRKIVNRLITEDNVNEVTRLFIEELQPERRNNDQ